MPRDWKFMLVASGIIAVFGFFGFYFVPHWGEYIQTPEQRIKYLERSIWCPI